jgi:hypothetical protein
MLNKTLWEEIIVDGDMHLDDGAGLFVGDIDGDGHQEIVAAGKGGIRWYRFDTYESGWVTQNGDTYSVGVTGFDLTGNGHMELVSSHQKKDDTQWGIVWFEMPANLHDEWKMHFVDAKFEGNPHDLLFYDIDQDGAHELVAAACYSKTPGLYIFKPELGNMTQPWAKSEVYSGHFNEGLNIADFDGDGLPEIICGADYSHMTDGDPLGKRWQRTVYAPNFREMCRTAYGDFTGNGKLDIALTESEYLDGRLSWFENKIENGKVTFVEHEILKNVVYGHSFQTFEGEGGKQSVMLGEMAQGGWKAPYNHDARILFLHFAGDGSDPEIELVYHGQGTHQACMVDIDNDGELEVVGKAWGHYWQNPKVHVFKKAKEKSMFAYGVKHQFIDRDKDFRATDIIPFDVNGNGEVDVICGKRWYEYPDWQPHDIPGVVQIINAYDIDGDGKAELIGTEPDGTDKILTNRLVWLKLVDPAAGKWEKHLIAECNGDWPHGSLIAPVLPGGKLALFCSYHSANSPTNNDPVEMFIVPNDPVNEQWQVVPMPISYGEEMVAEDLTGNGLLDVIAGQWWLENLGDGSFAPHQVTEGFKAARMAVMDMTGNGLPDILLGEEVLDYPNKVVPIRGKVVWFEYPGREQVREPWQAHVIEMIRCPHSLGVADLDGDGEAELVVGEHDPFYPYRSRCNLFVYKKYDCDGHYWKRYSIEDRFEHHDGTRIMRMASGELAVLSHGWNDERYISLWRFEK